MEAALWNTFLGQRPHKERCQIEATTFLRVAGADELEVYNTFTWENADDKLKVDKIVEKFNVYCIWQKKAWTCTFAELKDSLIRDRIVCRFTCDKACSRLLKESDLTLQATTTQLKSSGVSSTATVHDVHQLQKRRTSEPCHSTFNKCGTPYSQHQICLAQGTRCYNCGRLNHFARVCQAPPKKQCSKVHYIKHEHSDSSDDMFFSMVHTNNLKGSDWKMCFQSMIRTLCLRCKLGCSVMWCQNKCTVKYVINHFSHHAPS